MCINSTVLWMIKLMVSKQQMKIYNLLMVIKLELCITVQLLHVSTTGFWFVILKKKKDKKQDRKKTNKNM